MQYRKLETVITVDCHRLTVDHIHRHYEVLSTQTDDYRLFEHMCTVNYSIDGHPLSQVRSTKLDCWWALLTVSWWNIS